MMRYLVRYEIITHDADDYSTEEREFTAGSDEGAKIFAQKITEDRKCELERKGAACNIRSVQVLRAEYHPI